jgi:hypothetical protein
MFIAPPTATTTVPTATRTAERITFFGVKYACAPRSASPPRGMTMATAAETESRYASARRLAYVIANLLI